MSHLKQKQNPCPISAVISFLRIYWAKEYGTLWIIGSVTTLWPGISVGRSVGPTGRLASRSVGWLDDRSTCFKRCGILWASIGKSALITILCKWCSHFMHISTVSTQKMLWSAVIQMNPLYVCIFVCLCVCVWWGRPVVQSTPLTHLPYLLVMSAIKGN